jgi:hypothetical protein
MLRLQRKQKVDYVQSVGIDGNAENSFQRGEEISLGRTEERVRKNRGNNLKGVLYCQKNLNGRNYQIGLETGFSSERNKGSGLIGRRKLWES